jgi:hypothetical protein
MRIVCLATMAMVATMAFSGCGENTKTEPAEPFDLDGDWLYLGPWDGEHRIKITDTTAEYTDVGGEWKSEWSIKEYDNGQHHFQLAFKSGTGSYYPTGKDWRASFARDGVMLTLQLASGTGSYPPVEGAGSCTDGSGEPITDCRLYLKQ